MFNRELPWEPGECHFSYKTDSQTKKILQSNLKWALNFNEVQTLGNKKGMSANTTKKF